MGPIPTTTPTPDPDLTAAETAGSEAVGFSLRGRSMRTPVIVLAVVLVAELVARVLASGLPNPAWTFPQHDRKVDQMEAMFAARETVDVVLVGNSSVNSGFHVDDLEAFSGLGTFYNAALDGSSMRLIEDWTLNVVVPLVAPKVVVIGLTSRDLNDASLSNAEVFGDYLASRGRARFLGEETIGHKTRSVLSSLSALVRISPFLREPASLVLQYNPAGPSTGEFVLPGEEYAPRVVDITRTRERALNDYALGGIELESLTRLVRSLESQGIRVIVMEMPYVNPDYLDLHPEGAADYQAYREVVADFASTEALPYVDLTDYPWTTAEFYDFLHVNSAGIDLLNRMLAEALVGRQG
jgi:hypothetical protein